MTRKIVVGITGASGAIYAQRLIQLLLAAGIETHLVISPLGRRLLHDELGLSGIDLPALAGLPAAQTPAGSPSASQAAPPEVPGLVLHQYQDVGAPIASGSFRHDGMVIAPCSSNTLSAVATGAAQNLLHRAAAVTLKERRPLLLLHRETPLTLIDIRNMAAATEAGAIVMPASPGFYMRPTRVSDLVDFMVGRMLDLLHVEHTLDVRWGTSKQR